MTTIVFLLEEASAREMLKGLLPQILPSGFDVKFIVFEGKQHLDKELERKLRGWRLPNSTFIVLRDQDAQDNAANGDFLGVGRCSYAHLQHSGGE